MQGFVWIPQGALSDRGRVTQRTIPSGRVGATGKVAPSLCAPAFLTQKVDDILPEEAEGLNMFGIDIDKSYTYILKCIKRFCKCSGMKFKFSPMSANKARNLGILIDSFEEALQEQFGLEFYVGIKGSDGVEDEILQCAVYREGTELDEVIVVLYVAPAEYLSPKSAEYYKRFMKLFSQSTNIPLGIADNQQNWYLDAIFSMYDDMDYEQDDNNLDEYEIESKEKRNNLIKAYNEKGKFWNLFDEISSLPNQDSIALMSELEKYRKKCPFEELELIESMVEGIPVISELNCYWFDFNPYDDGIPDEHGYCSDDWASTVFASCILYSENDGVCEELMDAINNDVYSGLSMSGWNLHQFLHPKTKKECIDDIIRCKDIIGKFSKWLDVFLKEARKFDKYEQVKQCTE